MHNFVSTLLSLSVGGSLIAGLIVLLRQIPSKLPKSFFYYAWLLVLLRLVLPLPGYLALPKEQVMAPVQQSIVSYQEVPAPQPEAPKPVVSPAPVTPVAQPQVTPVRELPEAYKPLPKQYSIWDAAALVWALGFVLCLGRNLFGYFRFRGLLKKTLLEPRESDLLVYDYITEKRRPQLLRTTAVDTPMLMGVLHPMLLLPDLTYRPETLASIFRHELTHYRRGDILYKWFAMPVLAAHWFNPLTYWIRRDIDRCCELSCDERILKALDHDQRRSYGETLLVLAARNKPAKTALATTFSAEKKNLKERLVHIMNFSPKSKKTILAAVILLAAVTIFGILFGPSSGPTREGDAIVVKNVNQLLDALASDTKIILEPGTYDLTKAKTYGKANVSESYSWSDTQVDGYQLVLTDVHNLTITGRNAEDCEIVTRPRYAAVLNFRSCENVTLGSFTAGHTEGPGGCVGAVLLLDTSNNIVIDNCVLYGCGTYGVEAWSSTNVDLRSSIIKECSLGAATFDHCQDVQIRNSRVFACGQPEYPAYDLFRFAGSARCAVFNCDIADSYADTLMQNLDARDVYFLGNTVSGLSIDGTVFPSSGSAPVVDSCSFQFGGEVRWTDVGFGGIAHVSSRTGERLEGKDLFAMTYSPVDFTLPETSEAPEISEPAPTGAAVPGKDAENNAVTVSTVDEFLAAIAPNTTVTLAEGLFDLSTATDYGGGYSDYYYWQDTQVDGYELVIRNVQNFHLVGAGKGKTIFSALPRYANVLAFDGCSNISLRDLTAGHTETPAVCAGGVLFFKNCDQAAIDGCGLYGCGILGIIAHDSRNFDVTNTEIYECSRGAVALLDCKDFRFNSCNIHDCPSPYFDCNGCQNITLDAESIC